MTGPVSTTAGAHAVGAPLDDPTATTLTSGDLEAVFLPGHGMLGASLRYRGIEFLRQVDALQAAAVKGSTAGIPFLYPWANRLSGLRYQALGRSVVLNPNSPLLHFDGNGLPIHGVPWSHLPWDVVGAQEDSVTAELDWSTPEQISVFPFRHLVTMRASLQPDGLTIETSLLASESDAVPVSFGFHPYFGLPDLPRAQWHLKLPAMRKLVLNHRAIPTGGEQIFNGFDAQLGSNDFDDGFALLDKEAVLTVSGGGYRISVELLEGFPNTQVYAPKDKAFIALEPMTAPTNALISGKGLRIVEPGGQFHAVFRICIGEED